MNLSQRSSLLRVNPSVFALAIAIGSGLGLVLSQTGLANPGPVPNHPPVLLLAQATAPDQPPLDLARLQAETTAPTPPGICPIPPEVVTINTICQTRLTIPSLWWAKEQFGGRLLENWLAYSEVSADLHRIDLVVNPQVWSLLNYPERYAFVNYFGSSARDYRYNTRVFNRQGGFLAAYTCDFSQIPAQPSEATRQATTSASSPAGVCKILLNTSRRDGLRGKPPGL